MRVVNRGPYHRYHELSDKIEPIFVLFLTSPDSSYHMIEIAEKTKIPLSTLYTWRTRVRHEPEWRPQSIRFQSNPRAIEDPIEIEMAAYIRANFVSLGNDLSTASLKRTLTMLVHGLVACGRLPPTALNFKCSTTYMRRFLKRTGLSWRHARPARRPVLDEDECRDYVFYLNMSLEVLGRAAVVNFDESSWRLVMCGARTVAERGSESVERFVNGDVKASFTFFASIQADGTKLPLILIAKGKTQRCHRQFGIHPQFVHEIWHSPTGWCNEPLMIAYLSWLRHQITAPHIGLILDQYDAHNTLAVHQAAWAMGIELVFVPGGGTGKYQPLDRRTFGALKAMGRARWSDHYAENPGIICTREVAVELLLICWEELSQESVLAGWDLEDGNASTEDSSDDSDEDWSLQLEDSPDDSSSDENEAEDRSDDDSLRQSFESMASMDAYGPT